MRQVIWIGFRLLESQVRISALGVSSPELGKAGRRRPGTPNPVCCRGSGTSSSCTGPNGKIWVGQRPGRAALGREQTVDGASPGLTINAITALLRAITRRRSVRDSGFAQPE